MKKNSMVELGELGERIMVYGFYKCQFSDLQGKLLTIIDAIGLDEPQNKAVKDIVKSSLWEVFDHQKFIYEYRMDADGELKPVIRGSGETKK